MQGFLALQGGKLPVCAKAYPNSLKRGVQSLGGTLSTPPMEGQATEIRPEPKPVKWVIGQKQNEGEAIRFNSSKKFMYSGFL